MVNMRLSTSDKPMDTSRGKSNKDALRLDADLLIPGRGAPLHHATLISKEKKIVHVGMSCRQ